MRKVRVGLVGYGAWGRHHARAIAAVPNAELVAICTRSEANASAAVEEFYPAAVVRSVDELLARTDLDLCDVVLPSHLHASVATDVLQSGRHLLVEKPMTLSVVEGRRVIQLARAQGCLLAVGHELRLSSLWGRVKELIEDGAIGDPLYALIELWRRPYRLGSDGWRYDISRVGNWILEEPIHFFDLARWYFQRVGNPTQVYARGNGKRSDHPELQDNFSAIVSFPGGPYAVISQTLSAWEHHQSAKITGTHGALWASWSGAMDRTFAPTFSLKLQREERLEEIPIAKPSGEVYELVDQVAAVVNAVRDGTPVPCTGEDGLWSVALCEAAAESIQTGRPVALEDRSA